MESQRRVNFEPLAEEVAAPRDMACEAHEAEDGARARTLTKPRTPSQNFGNRLHHARTTKEPKILPEMTEEPL